MSRTRYKILENNQPYFLTCTTVDWIPLFTNPEIARIILNSLHFLSAHQRWRLYAYVIMEHHVHIVASSNQLSKEIGDFKSFTARCAIDYLKERRVMEILKRLEWHKLRHKRESVYQVWQEGSHPQLVQGVKMMRQKIEYIHNNPVRRGYIDDATDWQYSSAGVYAGRQQLIDVITEW